MTFPPRYYVCHIEVTTVYKKVNYINKKKNVKYERIYVQVYRAIKKSYWHSFDFVPRALLATLFLNKFFFINF